MSITDIAAAVLEVYKPLEADGRLPALPDKTELEKALTKLVGMKLLDVSTGVPVTEIINLVKKAVGRVQLDSGVLDGDGILGIKTVKWLLRNRRCDGPEPKFHKDSPKHQGPKPGDAQFDKRRINYFIEMVPDTTTGNPIKLLKTAFEAWMLCCGLKASRTHNREFANVIVKLAKMDGTGSGTNTLADAHTGPPDNWGSFQAELRFDIAETWTGEKFLTTAIHEIGHLLGLGHSTGGDSIMNPLLNTMSLPGTGDQQALRQFKNGYWGDPQPTF